MRESCHSQARRRTAREQLLAAAREVLAQNGYERTTVSSIATRANVAQGTFYLYFPSKEALPGALAQQFSDALGEATDRGDARGRTTLDDAVEALDRAPRSQAAEQHKDIIMIANRGIELATDWEEFLEITAPWREAHRGVPAPLPGARRDRGDARRRRPPRTCCATCSTAR